MGAACVPPNMHHPRPRLHSRDHSLVRQRSFNGPRAEPQPLPPSLPCSVDHQAAADRWQELEEALEGDKLSVRAGQGSVGLGGQAAAGHHYTRAGHHSRQLRTESRTVSPWKPITDSRLVLVAIGTIWGRQPSGRAEMAGLSPKAGAG